jgi:photosystem II stability/assembly factor-like uncharacterized protein
MLKKYCILSVLLVLACSVSLFAQDLSIHELLKRTDLTMQEIEVMANQYFEKVGTGQGSGYKQYQRWKTERQFHLRADGSFISREEESAQYQKASPNLLQNKKDKRGAKPWKELGPQSWTPTSGWNPGVGRLNAVAIHPSDEKTIYVGSPGGGIWKSTNSGKNWTPLIDDVNAAWLDVFCLSITPTNPDIIYAGLSSGRILKSLDAGKNWTITTSGPSAITKILIHPDSANIVYATAGNGLFRSSDGAQTWQFKQNNNFQDIEFQPNNPNVIIASTNTNAIYRSENNGNTFLRINLTGSGRTLIAVTPKDSNIVYAVQAKGDVFGRFYKSTDAGKTFITTIVGNAAEGTNFFGYDPKGKDTRGQANYDMGLCVSNTDANEVHIAGIICWKTIDGGESFENVTAWIYPNTDGYNHADVHGLEWVNNTIYSVSDGGIYKSTNNGDDWIDLSTGLGIRQFYRIACSKTDENAITGGAQDNGCTFRQEDGSWWEWLGADGMDTAISPTDANFAVGATQYGYLNRTQDGGRTKTSIIGPKNSSDKAIEGNWITPLAFHPNSHDTLFVGWDGIYRNDNQSNQWTKLTKNVATGNLNCLAIAPSDANYIYGTVGSRIFRTANGGLTWSDVSAGSTISSICVSPSDPRKIWVTTTGTSNNVKVSINMGTTFTNISTDLPKIAARSIVVDDSHTEGIYVGMNIGVYYRDNINTKWVNLSENLPLVAVNEVELQQSSRKVRLGTYGRGVWETSMQDIPLAVYAGKNAVINCTNKTAKLTATGGVSYLWNTGETTATIEVSPSVTTTYKVVGIMTDSTTSSDEVEVKVDNQLPIASIKVNGNLTLDCKNRTVSLVAFGGGSYLWSNGISSQTYTAFTGGTFTVTVTAANSCTATESVTTTLLSDTYDSTKVNACYNYTWAANRETYKKSGIYAYKEGCHTKHLILNILPFNAESFPFSPCDTSNLKVNENSMICFPNPFANELNVYFNLKSNATNVKIKIYDMQGRLISTIQQENINAGNYSKILDLSYLSNGVYPVCLEVDGKCEYVERVMMMK